jgi:hypothetical protein
MRAHHEQQEDDGQHGPSKLLRRLFKFNRINGNRVFGSDSYFWRGICLAALTVYVVYFLMSRQQPTDALEAIGHGSAALLL